MKTNLKENKTANLFTGILFLMFLGLMTGCGGGGATPGQGVTAENGVPVTPSGENSVVVSNQQRTKIELCTEVNGWATSCRFVGMKYLKMTEEVLPLTEEFGGKNQDLGGQV